MARRLGELLARNTFFHFLREVEKRSLRGGFSPLDVSNHVSQCFDARPDAGPPRSAVYVSVKFLSSFFMGKPSRNASSRALRIESFAFDGDEADRAREVSALVQAVVEPREWSGVVLGASRKDARACEDALVAVGLDRREFDYQSWSLVDMLDRGKVRHIVEIMLPESLTLNDRMRLKDEMLETLLRGEKP